MAEVRSLVLSPDGTMKQVVPADSQSIAGTLTTASGNLVLDPADDVQIAAGKDLSLAAGAGGVDLSAGTGAFKTTTGAVTISGSSVAIDSTGVDDTLTIGANSENISIGAVGKLVTFAGDVQIDGAQTVVGETTFQQDATFEGNTTFGDNSSPDSVTFSANTTVDLGANKITNMADPTAGSQDAATAKYVDDGLGLKLDLAGGTMSGAIAMGSNLITGLSPGVAGTDAANVNQVDAVAAIKYDQELFVAKNGSDSTGTGAVLKPFASISAAMAAITDASPTKRYAIRVETGAYTEASALNLKPNVFIIGSALEAVRITASSFGLDASFTGAADNRSGIINAILVGACAVDFNAVTSSQGKLFFQRVSFSNAVTMNGNSTVNQVQFDSCTFFGTFTVSGVNVGVFSNNRLFTSIVLNQHPSVATILNASGGFADSLTATAAVNNFNRRCSVFSRGLKFDGTVTVDGPSAYFDYTVGSLPAAGATVVNGGNLVSADFGANKALSNLVFPTAVNNPIMPATTSVTNFGDWNKQWAWSFAWLHASTGSDCYLASYPSAFGSEGTAGKNVYVFADAGGLAANISGGIVGLYTNNATGTGASGDIEVETGTAVNGNSGDITLTTGAVSGTGTRGQLVIAARQIDAGSVKIVNVADPTNDQDAATKKFVVDNTVSSFSGGTTGLTPSSATTGAVTLSGTLSVENGGTGAASLTSGSLLKGNGTGAVAEIAPGTNGQVLKVVSGAWVAADAPGGDPAGNDTEVQFNNSGAFGADSKLTFNATNGVLSVTADAAAVEGPLRLSNADGLFVDTMSTEARLSILNPLGSESIDFIAANGVLINNGTGGSIKMAALPWFLIEATDSMNLQVVNFDGAIGMQTGGVDHVLIGGNDGGGMAYLQTQNGVRLETKGEFWIKAQATLPALAAGTGKLAVKSDGDGVLFFVDSAGQAHYAMPDGLNSLGSVSGNVTLDFDPALPAYRTLTVGGALTFQTPSDNLAAGRGMSLRLDNSAGGSSTRVLTFPNDWTWLAGSKPVQIEAGKVGIVSLVSYGTDDAGIVAAWAYSDSVGITGGGTAGQVAYFDGTRTIKSEGGLAWDETNDRLNIGNADNSAHSANLRVGGSAHIGGEVFLDGNVDLGDAAADVITVNGAMSLASGASFDGTAGTVDLPAQFSIDGSAVSADVTAANLNTLTGGSDASALHTHASAGAVIVALNTSANSLAAGDVVCADPAAALQVKKADADASQATARVLGVVDSAGKVMLAGLASAKFKSGLTVAIGEPAYLSLDAGELTNVAPTTGAISEVGVIVSIADYAGATKCIVALQIKAPIFLS